LLIRRFEERNR
jgi:hypothetical protein